MNCKWFFSACHLFWVYFHIFFRFHHVEIFYFMWLNITNFSITINNPFWVYKRIISGLPWWRSGWESACQCRGHGFEPWSGRIPHAAEQLGPWATVTEPTRLEPVLHSKRGRDSERSAHRDEEWPPLAATRESRRTKRRPNTATK